MRRITAGLFISLDGVVEEPGDWHFPYFNDEMGVAVDSQIGAADTLLLGRKTYDSFAGAWPDREAAGGEDASFAKVLGDQRKIVVSNQNLQFTWRNSEQLKGDLVGTGGGLRSHGGPPRFVVSVAFWRLVRRVCGGEADVAKESALECGLERVPFLGQERDGLDRAFYLDRAPRFDRFVDGDEGVEHVIPHLT